MPGLWARCLTCVVFIALWFTSVVAWGGSLRFERIMTESGVSVAETNAITQDRRGFIWIGGSNGLVRYDTHQFEIFSNHPGQQHSLSNNFVWDILEDSRGNLWVATTNGLNRFEPETQTFVRYLHSSQDPNSLISNDVYTLFEDRDGQLWVGTRQGLARLLPDGSGFRNYRHEAGDPRSLSDSSITAIFQDSMGSLWVGTARGLNRFRVSSDSFERFEHPRGREFYPPHSSIRDVKEDHQDNLWVATDVGLYRFNLLSGHAHHYQKSPGGLSDNRVWKLTIDSQQQLWVATDHGGLNLYQPSRDRFHHYRHDPFDSGSLASDQVRMLFEDQAGDYWVALFPSGVDYASSSSRVFSVYRHAPNQPNSLNHDAVLSVAPGPGQKIWIGTEGGLNLLDPSSGKFTHFSHDPGNPVSLGANAVLAITQDQQGDYWFGTWSGGLNRYDPNTGHFERFLPSEEGNSISSAYIWSLLGDSQGYLWIGTEGGGLDRYHPETDRFEHFKPDPEDPDSLSGGFMRALVEDHHGNIWIATLQGLNRYNPQTGKFQHYQHRPGDPSSLPHNSVAALFEDSQQRLWVGTESGLARLNDDGSFTTYLQSHGLPSNAIMGISEDAQGYLWISTLKGLSRFAPRAERFSNFTRNNGLAGNIMNRPAIYFHRGERMFVGSTSGLTAFEPHYLKDNTFIPPVYLTGFSIFNQQVQLGEASVLSKHIQYADSITLNHRQNMFSLDFAALSYRDSGNNQYRYRMQGFDDQWIEAGGANRATYTNLDPGRYVFTVRAANNNGVWNNTGHSITIFVQPPPWRTWWAYTLYGLAVLVGIGLFVRSQQQKVAFERQKVAQLRAVDKLKDEFLANTSHELRTPLNGIIGLTESLLDDTGEPLPDKARVYLSMIASSGRRLSNLINDVLDFSKLKNRGLELRRAPTNFLSVCDTVCMLSRPLAEQKGIQLINAVPEDLPRVMADEDRLQQILYNLVGNAIKFTFSGHVKIYAEYNDSFLRCSVEDTGIGIPEEDLGSIFESFTQGRGDAAREFEGTGLGLAVAKNLIELHGGTISVTSKLERGSTFHFSLPICQQMDSDVPVGDALDVRVNQLLDVGDEPELVVTEAPNVGKCPFHILVVDDDAINRQVLIGQLSLHHYRISEAANGQDALDLIKTDPTIDLVLLDVMMPRMTGYETAVQIRKIKPVHELPIIFITAKHLASDLVAGFVSGGNDFLIKPVSKNELLARTKTHLLLLDVTRNLEKLVEERTNSLQATQQALVTVDNIVGLINQQSSVAGVATILLQESAQLLLAPDIGAFWLVNESGTALNRISTFGDDVALELFSPIIPGDLRHAERSQLNLQRGVQVVMPERLNFIPNLAQRIDSALVMVIETDGQLAGLLAFVTKKGEGVFSPQEQENFSRLENHVISAVSKAKMLAALKRQNQKLEHMSYTDSLTGLYNRYQLLRHLPADLALCRRKYEASKNAHPDDADLLFILVDIDNFKSVNDTYGHAAGDAILKRFSEILKSVFRESDHIIRWGGEEFLVVVRFFDRRHGAELAERLRCEVAATSFDIDDGRVLSQTCSVGYSCYPFYRQAPEAYSWEQVVELADRSLYAAKNTSRNAWVGVSGSPDTSDPPSFAQVQTCLSGDANSNTVVVCSSAVDPNSLQWE